MVALMATFSETGFAQDEDAYRNAAQTALKQADMIHAQVRVAAINAATNSVTLRGPHGNLADVDVNPAVADVSRLRVGDRLNVAYQQALLLHIDKLATQGVRERVETTVAIPASAGFVSSAHRVRVVATVTKIDRTNRLVTLRGPRHRQVLRAASDIPLDELKVGDSIRAEFVSAVAVELVRD
ncbi:copper-binding protein [Paraburkholderia panacisoli]|uniref:Copper-binding protein n=2 Tax=Paraburkholderia panacisoli TaxID=2603818 RepID=A0A5B0HBL2_9BURK|nr:copper-binding protein [Paraburkholderia panacisoli]